MSTVIKAGQAGQVLKHLSTVDLADHLAEAAAVVARAEHRAARIVERTRSDAAEALARAEKSGYEAGYRLGFEEGVAAGRDEAYRDSVARFSTEHGNVVASLQSAVAQIEAIKEELRFAAEKDLIDFAVSVASKLTFEIGCRRRESAISNLQRALPLVASKSDLTIRVHPDDLASLENLADSALKQVNASRAVSIVADGSVSPGGCKVLCGHTEIDATLETQVAEMVSLLVEPSADHD
ncbi:MAG: FliH/SctL family protein [Phycisphaerae bacterium]